MSKGLKPMWVILEEKTEGKEHVTFVAMENICKSYSEQEINRPVSEGGCGSKKAFFSFILEIQDYLYTKKKKKNVCILVGNIHLPLLCGHGWIPMYPASSCSPFSILHVPKDEESVHFTVFNTNKDWSTM